MNVGTNTLSHTFAAAYPHTQQLVLCILHTGCSSTHNICLPLYSNNLQSKGLVQLNPSLFVCHTHTCMPKAPPNCRRHETEQLVEKKTFKVLQYDTFMYYIYLCAFMGEPGLYPRQSDLACLHVCICMCARARARACLCRVWAQSIQCP